MLNVKVVSFENLDIKSVVILASSYLFSFLRTTLLHVTKSYFYWVKRKLEEIESLIDQAVKTFASLTLKGTFWGFH